MNFADFYDLMLSDIDYNIYLHTFKKYLKTTCKIVDLGCGTGSFLAALLANGYKAIGVDNDEEMLERAKKKINRENHLFYADIRKPLNLKADLIFMLFDVINYNLDYQLILKNIYNALNDNGILIFDFYQENKIRKYNNYKESGTNYNWEIKIITNKIYHDLKFYNNEKTITQYIHSKKLMEKALKDLNFNYKFIKGPDKRKHYIVCLK